MQLAFDFDEAFISAARPPTRAARQLRRNGRAVQPCIPGLELTRLDSLFLAVKPDREAADQIGNMVPQLAARYGLAGKPLPTERLHVTVHGLGGFEGVPAAPVAQMCQAADRIEADGFEVRFDRLTSFPRPSGLSPLVLTASQSLDALCGFRSVLRAAMVREGFRVGREAFTPHMTLLYDRRVVAECAVPAVCWRARSFVLVHSLHGHSRHVTLAEWPLAG